MSTHIDTLAEWWDEAAPGIPKMGDTYIEDERHRGSSFRIVEAATDHKYGFENIRILHRAPAPKPAWHDAVAVIASASGMDSRVWERAKTFTGRTFWRGTRGEEVTSDDLRDVAPLIEQKVTGDMIDRIEHHFISTQGAALPVGFARRLLHIALNLDPA